MALGVAIALLGLHLVDADLLALALFQDLAGHGSAVHIGSAKGAGFSVDDGEDLVEGDGGAFLGVQLLDEDHVALRHAVLLAAGDDDCVFHAFIVPSFRARYPGSGRKSSGPT